MKRLVVVLHYDMFPELPIFSIIEYARQNDCVVVGIAAYTAALRPTGMDLVIYPQRDGSWPRDLNFLAERDILLTGGYKNLCIQDFKDYLEQLGATVEISNDPAWVVEAIQSSHADRAIESMMGV